MSYRLDYPTLKRVCANLGHRFFDRGDYNLNIIGIRTSDLRSNLFNDWICLAFRQNDMEQLLVFSATTDPGTYWREHPMNVDGTAILAPGQYPAIWEPGKHRNTYLALVQRGECTVYRDNDGDKILDMCDRTRQTGHFGINLHRASHHGESTYIDKWSAGCQVIASSADFDLFMEIVMRSAREHGHKFTYTLLTEHQLIRHGGRGP